MPLPSLGLLERFSTVQEALPKFTKRAAYYVSRSLTPATCARCPWFLAPERCAIVDEAGAPDAGRILPGGVCGLYAAGPVRIAAYEFAYGRDSKEGFFPQAIRDRVIAQRRRLDSGGAV